MNDAKTADAVIVWNKDEGTLYAKSMCIGFSGNGMDLVPDVEWCEREDDAMVFASKDDANKFLSGAYMASDYAHYNVVECESARTIAQESHDFEMLRRGLAMSSELLAEETGKYFTLVNDEVVALFNTQECQVPLLSFWEENDGVLCGATPSAALDFAGANGAAYCATTESGETVLVPILVNDAQGERRDCVAARSSGCENEQELRAKCLRVAGLHDQHIRGVLWKCVNAGRVVDGGKGVDVIENYESNQGCLVVAENDGSQYDNLDRAARDALEGVVESSKARGHGR